MGFRPRICGRAETVLSPADLLLCLRRGRRTGGLSGTRGMRLAILTLLGPLALLTPCSCMHPAGRCSSARRSSRFRVDRLRGMCAVRRSGGAEVRTLASVRKDDGNGS
jgi:hypothetical protein